MTRAPSTRAVVPFLLAVSVLVGAGCLGSAAIKRSYYVLHGVGLQRTDRRAIAGQVRVRNLDAASVYEKFQIVVRRSPYELSYSETDVWAVKPNQMVSDVIAEALTANSAFTSVVREFGDLRPDFIISGDLNAIEVYDSDDVWYAHLDMVLQLSRFSNAETLVTYKFDERKHIPSRTFAQGARAISELLSTALEELAARFDALDLPRAQPGQEPPPVRLHGPSSESPSVPGKLPGDEEAAEPSSPLFIPAPTGDERKEPKRR